jgi:hypothetical protein
VIIRLVGRILYAVISAVIFVLVSSSITSQQCGFLPPREDTSNGTPEVYSDVQDQLRRGWERIREQERRARESLRRRQENERERYGDSQDLRRSQREEWEKLKDYQRSQRRDHYRNGGYPRADNPESGGNPAPRQ